MKRDSDRMEPLVDSAIQAIKTIFIAGEHEEGEIQAAHIATRVLATWAKLKQSERAQEGLYFAMARELSQDGNQLKKYLEITMPEVPLVKVLDARKLPEGKKK